MLLIIYLITHLLATFLLIQGIRIAIKEFNFKTDFAIVLSIVICLLFLGCSIYLSWVSFAYWLFFGLIVAGFHMTLIPESYSSLKRLIVTLTISFFFWPESVCFIIFTLYYLNNISDNT